MRDRYLHRFGNGKGFGAEILDMSWALYQCSRVGITFALQEDPKPIGVACFQGWNDYFKPFCPTVRVERFGGCNRYYYSRLLGAPQRLISRKLLDLQTQSNNYYLFDCPSISRLPAIDSRFSSGQDRDTLFRNIYHYSLATEAAINLRLSKLPKVNSDWISIHIRRGDKITESNYVDIDCYVKALGQIDGWRERPIFVMSDSAIAIVRLAEAVRRTIYSFSASQEKNQFSYGYNQDNFNSKHAKIRHNEILDLLAEIEVARNSGHFLGSASSNLFHVVRLFRGNPYLSLLNVSNSA